MKTLKEMDDDVKWYVLGECLSSWSPGYSADEIFNAVRNETFDEKEEEYITYACEFYESFDGGQLYEHMIGMAETLQAAFDKRKEKTS